MRTLWSPLIAAAMMVASALSATAAGPSTTQVRLFSDGQVVAGSSASLVRTNAGVGATLSTSGLVHGDVVDMWWVIFNYPENCAGPSAVHPFQCGPSDLGNPAVQASLLLATGRVIDGTSTSTYGAQLKVGDTSNALFGPGLLLPETAHVHLLLNDHGAADPRNLSEQLHSFGACNPTCINVQFAVFES